MIATILVDILRKYSKRINNVEFLRWHNISQDQTNFCDQNEFVFSLNPRNNVTSSVFFKAKGDLNRLFDNEKIYLARRKFTLQQIHCLVQLKLRHNLLLSSDRSYILACSVKLKKIIFGTKETPEQILTLLLLYKKLILFKHYILIE